MSKNLKVIGDHEANTISQMHDCMRHGDVLGGVLCADGHLGYAQPVGGVIAYRDQISISGVGFDIGCGNLAARLDVPYRDIMHNVPDLMSSIQNQISFGVGRINDTGKVNHPVFDEFALWDKADMVGYKPRAREQLGTVGSGNHYVDLLRDNDGWVWIGVHFGSRGLGHTTATKYIKAAGGKDGINVPPALVDVNSDLGEQYLAGMKLAGLYAAAGREWVVNKVRQLVGGTIQESVHNHHNYAWKETHQGEDVWVVRKGATPAFPGQRGFVGGSMGDDALIVEGIESEEAASNLYSTIHGAGRTMGRAAAKKTFDRGMMDAWLQDRGVVLRGGDLDESPMAYRRLANVIEHHRDSVKIVKVLRPFGVVMAGAKEFDPFKD